MNISAAHGGGEDCRASGDQTWLRGIMADLGYAYALQSRLADGGALLEAAVSASLATGARRAAPEVRLSEVCRLMGRSEEAWQHARQALDLSRQKKACGNEARALHQLGTVHAHADPPEAEQAEAHYCQALVLAEELGMRPLQAHCHLGLGTLYAQTGQREPAHAELSMAIDLYCAMAMTFWLPQAKAVLAQYRVKGVGGPLPQLGVLAETHRLRKAGHKGTAGPERPETAWSC
jgi:tetratricopeptide (TPR) repeat protein